MKINRAQKNILTLIICLVLFIGAAILQEEYVQQQTKQSKHQLKSLSEFIIFSYVEERPFKILDVEFICMEHNFL